MWYLKGEHDGVAQAGLLVISDGDLRKIEFKVKGLRDGWDIQREGLCREKRAFETDSGPQSRTDELPLPIAPLISSLTDP